MVTFAPAVCERNTTVTILSREAGSAAGGVGWPACLLSAPGPPGAEGRAGLGPDDVAERAGCEADAEGAGERGIGGGETKPLAPAAPEGTEAESDAPAVAPGRVPPDTVRTIATGLIRARGFCALACVGLAGTEAEPEGSGACACVVGVCASCELRGCKAAFSEAGTNAE